MIGLRQIYVLAIHVLNKTLMISVIPCSCHMTLESLGHCAVHTVGRDIVALERILHPFLKCSFIWLDCVLG